MKTFPWKSLILNLFLFGLFLPPTVFPPFVWGQERFELEILPDESAQNLSFWYDQIEAVRMHPVDLNSASKESMMSIPGIPKSLAEFLIAYRNQHGPFKSKKDLRNLLNLSDDDWAWFSQFISVNRSRRRAGIWFRSRFSGGNNPPIVGRNLHSYQRFQMAAHSMASGGFLLEKDPLETNWSDHFVGFLRTSLGKHASLLVGDYFPAFGQGLLLGLPYILGKSVSPDKILKTRSGSIRGDVSSLEDHYFRGSVASVSWKGLNVWLFGSRNAWDARIDSASGVATLQIPAVHSGTYLSRKKIVKESLGGVRLEARRRVYSMGLTILRSKFSRPVIGLKNEWPLRTLNLLGMDFQARYRILTLTGEWMRHLDRGESFSLGGQVETKAVTWVFALRNFGEEVWNPHGFAFGEQGVPQNEKGLYSGFVLRVSPRAQIQSFLDVFLFPKITETAVPNRFGREWAFRWEEKWSSFLRTMLRFAFKEKSDDLWIVKNGWDFEKITAQKRRSKFQVLWWLRPAPFWTFKGHIQAVRAKWIQQLVSPLRANKGFLFSEELGYIFRSNVRISAGWDLFNTDSYDSRIYAYEPGLPGQFSVEMFYGKGSRIWIGTRWKFFASGQLFLKYFAGYRRVKPGINYRLLPEENLPEKGLAIQLDFHR